MAYVITEPCVGTCDTACVDVCPCDCIRGPIPVEEIRKVPEEERRARWGTMQLYIDPEPCIDCGACMPVCPVGAIFPDNGIPEKYRHFVELNARVYKNPA